MIALRILLVLLALFVGVIGFFILFAIGEGTGSGVAAYAADTLLFSLSAYGLSRLDPLGRPFYAILMCAPVLLLSIGGADPAGGLLSLVMTAITLAAAILPPPPARAKG